ncbi:MAG: hypothetical protein H0W31_00085 [Actinobacteria bacterium]|nr:hypothetical protein [Actinomycetota bacterium]
MTQAALDVPFIHPETGEVLEAQADFLKALDEITERMTPLWKIRRRIRESYAERFEAPLPSDRRNRTQTQERVHWCPRCGLARVEGDPQ